MFTSGAEDCHQNVAGQLPLEATEPFISCIDHEHIIVVTYGDKIDSTVLALYANLLQFVGNYVLFKTKAKNFFCCVVYL